MRSAAILAQLSLWVAGTNAFYPWFPQYRCSQDGTCEPEKRQIGGLGDDAREALEGLRVPTLEIDRIESPEKRGPRSAARDAQRLAQKYPRFRSPQDSTTKTTLPLERRQNNYRVMEPDETSQENAAGIYQDGSDFSYFVRAKLGSDGKEIFMLMDTGASTSWAMGADCESEACKKHTTFGPDDSDTLEELNDGFSVNYGTGSVKGNRVRDTLSVAGIEQEMIFGLTNETSSDFEHFAFDGLLGLSMSRGNSDNFMGKVKESGVLDDNIFCILINRAADGRNTGEISFGECNDDKYEGDFTYASVPDDRNDWAITLDGITYDGDDSRTGEDRVAIIDTGTSYVFGTKKDVEEFHGFIDGAESTDGVTWTVPCDTDGEVQMEFGGKAWTVSAQDWISEPDDDDECTSNIYGHEIVRNGWLVGDLFLKNVYAVFDTDERRIGFAKRAPIPSDDDDDDDEEDSSPSGSGNSQITQSLPPVPSGTSSSDDYGGSDDGEEESAESEESNEEDDDSAGVFIRPAQGLVSVMIGMVVLAVAY